MIPKNIEEPPKFLKSINVLKDMFPIITVRFFYYNHFLNKFFTIF